MSDGTQARAMNRRLILEEICGDILRYAAHERQDQAAGLRIDHEWDLGVAHEFADMRVRPDDGPPYFLEIKAGYTDHEVLRRLRQKYGRDVARSWVESRVIVVLDMRGRGDRDQLLSSIRAAVAPSLAIELWDESTIESYTRALFAVPVGDLSDDRALARLRRGIDDAKVRLAFGSDGPDADNVLRQGLLWHLGARRLKELRGSSGGDGHAITEEAILPAAHYERAVVLFVDISSFSSFVRDTPDEEITRASLTAFYAKARDQILDSGGMFYQFVGDEVSAVFGVPDQRPGYPLDAVRAAVSLLGIAKSVMSHWQRRIDRVQARCAAHIGMAMGDLDLVAQRPFDGARLGAFGDTMNIAARLQHTAGPGEIVVSNVLRQELADTSYGFDERPEIEIKNLGTVRSWRLLPDSLLDRPTVPTVS